MSGSYEVPGFKPGVLVAGADLSAKQHRFMKIHASGRVVACDTEGEASIGILQGKPTSGQPAEIDGDGVSLAVLGATVASGATVMTDVNGAAITATSGKVGLGICFAGGSAAEEVAVYQKSVGKV